MYDLLRSELKDEIDLREIFIILWAYKLIIACTFTLGVLSAGYYTINADKIYSSSAVFKLNKTRGSISLGGDLGALASLTGLAGGITSPTLPTDQINGRIFIENLDAKLNFFADPYFNKYDQNLVDPIWKSIIKRVIGWEKYSSDINEVIWHGIIKTYTKNVTLEETPDGSFKIVAWHESPQRAAEIANFVMEEIIKSQKNKSDKLQDERLSYLSLSLAKALTDLEVSQFNLKEFALENSALPLESFAARSLQLDALREQLNRTSELHEAVAALSLLLQNKTTDNNDYTELRQRFPIVDQVEFRRVLGQNEIISSWSWPKASSVIAVFDTLTERISRLQSQINASQIDAERSGVALEVYARLEREAKVAEATYTVLIEQLKAQSMAAGYRPDNTEIFEYASVSISPSSPKRKLVLLLGATLGLFVGATLSVILAHRRGVYFSRNSLKAGAQARLTASIRALMPLRNKSLKDLNTILVKKPKSVLRDLAVEIYKSETTQVVVTSSRAKLMGNDLARALACYMQSDALKIAVINFSSRAKKLNNDDERLSIGSFVVLESEGNVSVLKPNCNPHAMEFLNQRDFVKNIQSLNSTFDLVYLCADNEDTISLLSALQSQKTLHITLARIRKTKSATITQMRSLLPIQGLLYD